MELEFFCEPGTDLECFAYWRNFCYQWLIDFGLKPEEIRTPRSRQGRTGILFQGNNRLRIHVPFGWRALGCCRLALTTTSSSTLRIAPEDLSLFDPATNQKYIPYVIEPSARCGPVALAFLCSAYDESEIAPGDVRTVLRFAPALAPVKVAPILPLSAKLSESAEPIYHNAFQEMVLRIRRPPVDR
jgi:glycyl-tRNA synthetase